MKEKILYNEIYGNKHPEDKRDIYLKIIENEEGLFQFHFDREDKREGEISHWKSEWFKEVEMTLLPASMCLNIDASNELFESRHRIMIHIEDIIELRKKEREKIELPKEEKTDEKREEAQYWALKMELEGSFRKMINSFIDDKGFYPEEVTTKILRNLTPIPVFQKNPELYVKWAKEQNEEIKKENPEQDEDNRIRINVHGSNKLISDFAKNLGKGFKEKNVLFYRSELRDVVEIGNIKTTDGKILDNGFITLDPNRFVTLLEKYFIPEKKIMKEDKDGNIYPEFIKKSIISTTAKTVLVSPQFQDVLPVINRIFNVQQPVIYEGELTFPKICYDKRFGSWLPSNSAKIDEPNMDLETAKKTLNNLFSEFCFKDEQSKVNAIAGLLTPYLRGLFSKFNVRTPIFVYLANRERAGKDYCAGITGIVYEGEASEEPPISNNEKSTNSNEELRKKILSAMIIGRKRFHSSNNKGLMDNAVFESVTTATKFSDRLLGKNDIVNIDNEIDYSFSGNIGMALTPDLANRSLFINLFLDIENANERKFDNPDLHGYVRENRGLILSALYTLIRNWDEKDRPDGSFPFASYPEWAKICGGIMECADLGNPCGKMENTFQVSLDPETDEMKQLFEFIYEKRKNQLLKKNMIKDLVVGSNEDIFEELDFTKRSDQSKFGKQIDKYVNRILSDIKLICHNPNIRGSRKEYKFVKVGDLKSP